MSTAKSHASTMRLADLIGPLVLVGAGKMGGAMLEGWLSLGLDPATVVVIEPQPAPEITALATRGVGLNPQERAVAEAFVVAVKPQVAPDVISELIPFLGEATVTLSIM